jgi:hypothetical protein
MPHMPRRGNFTGRINDAANGPLRPDLVPDTAVRINSKKRLFIQRRARAGAMELPPWQPV